MSARLGPVLFTTLVLAIPPVWAEALLPEVSVPMMTTPPVIDGRILEDEWAGAVRNVGLCSQHDLRLETREAIFWCGSDGKNLYIAIRSEVPPGDKLLTRAVPDGDRDIEAAVYDDSVELVIHPHLGAISGDQRYFHLIVNARGALFDRAFDPADAANPVKAAWRLRNWKFHQQINDGWWDVEIDIPFSEIGATAADLSHPWGLRICRNWQRPWDQSRWESVAAAYEDVATLPKISFRQDAPVVQVLGLRGDSAPRIELSLANPGRETRRVRVFLSDTWSQNPPTEMTKDLVLSPGTREIVIFEPPHGGPEGDHHTVLQVTSPDGKQVFYVRDFRWRFERPEDRWTIAKQDKAAIELQYAVYPSYGKVKARVDIAALASRDSVTGVDLSFARKGEEKPLVSRRLQFRDYAAEDVLDMPSLREGQYEVRAALVGGDGVPREPVVASYERRVFAWEGNKLGLSERVIPPFTPIRVKGNIVSTVLRDHQVAGSGAWQQVTSLGRELLKAPMRWVVQRGGRSVPVRDGQFRVLSGKPHFTVTEGGFTAGPVKVRVRTEWDLDGMAKVFLTLLPSAGATVDRLSLEIPLDDAQMIYMHACGDGLRYNYAGKAPAGEGAVWDSSKANKTNIVGTFYPYLWLGGGERGLAWFADSDRGWSLDETTPTLELERRADVLTLRVNFVTRATALDSEREIVFGLQATPAKPMPEEPVNWRRWICQYYESQKVQPFKIIGSSYYYGCLSYDFYPREHDLSIYEALSRARDTGEYNKEFVDKWMEGYKPYAEPGTELWTFFLNHVSYAMRDAAACRRSQGWLWTPYTNARGLGYHMAEWPTFQDEWINFAYHPRSTKGNISYDICPTRSFQDAALWYYQEMMTCFDGIYWDNIFLAANYDTVAGGAWVDEKERVHPSMGLWAMRDLIKRTAFLFHEKERPVFANVAHMTNTNIVPILSFANISLDWEWQYGKRDFQERFTPELTVAETIGRQCGNVPLILAGGETPSTDPAFNWMMRTRLGVCLVHELRVWDWQPKFHYDTYGKLFEFGYGDKDCRVYNYWDEGFPLRIEGCDARGIVMVRGKRALVVVTDYGEGGVCRLVLDLKALGLPETVKPTDFESGQALESEAPGQMAFDLKKHDFRAVLFE